MCTDRTNFHYCTLVCCVPRRVCIAELIHILFTQCLVLRGNIYGRATYSKNNLTQSSTSIIRKDCKIRRERERGGGLMLFSWTAKIRIRIKIRYLFDHHWFDYSWHTNTLFGVVWQKQYIQPAQSSTWYMW